MARKKITPEEELPKTVTAESSETADGGDIVQAGPPPGNSETAVVGAKTSSAEETGRAAEENAAEAVSLEESGECIPADIPAEKATLEKELAPSADGALVEEARTDSAWDVAISAAVESVLEARREETEDPGGAAGSDMGDVNLTLGSVEDLHEPTSESVDYSIDLSEDQGETSAADLAAPSTEESEWGFDEPLDGAPVEELSKEKTPVQPALAATPKGQAKSDRQLFYELKFNSVDRDLTPEERQEWNAIYASYRGRSSLSDKVIGVDPHSVYVWNRRTEKREKLTMFCPIIVRYRVPIVIPESEMWEKGKERPDFVTKNISGAKLDFIITKVDREKGFAVASRRLASRSQRYFFAHREDLHQVGARIKCRMVAVGPRRCLVECYGHDIELTQREISYSAIPDLRTKYHPGDEYECIVKLYDPVKAELVISIKETEINPFIGAEQRHPVGSRRLAMISGKYGGGVFCNLPDGTVCMCNYSYQHDDSDFMVGENVMLVVQRYDDEKLQMFGKIMSKW